MLVSLSTLLRGTMYERLRWTFTLYDLNKDGYITKQEVRSSLCLLRPTIPSLIYGKPLGGTSFSICLG